MKFCGMGASQGSLLALVPDLSKFYMPVVDAAHALAGMDAGLCQLAIVPKIGLEVAQRGAFTPDTPDAHCNKTAIGQVLTSIGISMPIRPELQQPMSWAMTLSMSRGEYDKAAVEARRAYLGANACGQAVGEKKGGMKLAEMTGIFIITASGMVAGLLANFFYFSGMRAARGFEKNEDAPGEPAAAAAAADGETATVEVTLHNFPKSRIGTQPRIVVRYVDVEGGGSNPEVGSDDATLTPV